MAIPAAAAAAAIVVASSRLAAAAAASPLLSTAVRGPPDPRAAGSVAEVRSDLRATEGAWFVKRDQKGFSGEMEGEMGGATCGVGMGVNMGSVRLTWSSMPLRASLGEMRRRVGGT